MTRIARSAERNYYINVRSVIIFLKVEKSSSIMYEIHALLRKRLNVQHVKKLFDVNLYWLGMLSSVVKNQAIVVRIVLSKVNTNIV